MRKLILIGGVLVGAVLFASGRATAQGLSTHSQRVFNHHNTTRMSTDGGGRLFDSIRNQWYRTDYGRNPRRAYALPSRQYERQIRWRRWFRLR